MALEAVSVKFNANTAGLEKGLKAVRKGVDEVKTGLSSIVKTAAGLAGVAAAVTGLVQLAEQYRVLRNAVQRTNELFRDSARYVKAFAETANENFGIAESSVYEYAMTYGNMFKSMTRDSRENAAVTISALKTTAIIASKTGRTINDVGDRIRSGISGNTQAIEDLGIYVNANMIKTSNAFKKLAGSRSWDKLTYQEQQQIRYLAILEQSQSQYGDSVSRIAGTSLPRLGQMFKDLVSYSGLLVNAGLQPIIDALANIVMAATAAVKALSNLLGLDVAGDVKPGAEMQHEFADATDEATKAAKRQQRALAGFDELNILKRPEKAGDSGGGSGLDSPFADLTLDEPTDLGGNKWEQTIRDFIGLFDFAPLVAAWDNLKKSIAPIWDNIKTGGIWLYENVLVPLAQWTIGDLIPAFLNLLAGAAEVLGAIIEGAKPALGWLWDNFLAPIANWVGGAIVDTINWLADALTRVGDWIKDHQAFVETMTIILGSFATAWAIVNLAIGAWNIVAGIATTVTTAFGAAVAFLTSPIGIVTVAIGAVIAAGVLLYKNWDTIKTKALALWDGLKKVFSKVGAFFADVWQGVKRGFVSFVNFLITGINSLIEGFLCPFNLLIKGWNSTLGKLIGTIPEIKVAIPKIPALARGGTVDRPTIATIGEAGPETVVPLAESGLIAAIRQAIIDGLASGRKEGPADGGGDIILKIDGAELARATVSNVRALQRQTGRDLILGVR